MRQFIRRLIYNPYRAARADSRILLSDRAILLGSTRFNFRFQGGRVEIGADSIVGGAFIFESDAGLIRVGERTYIGPGTNMISRRQIEIGSDVTIGWGVYLYDHSSHSLDWRDRAADITLQLANHRCNRSLESGKNWDTVKSAPIVVSDKAWIGFDAVVLKGVTIGEGAVVAARSMVTQNVPPWTVVAGNPAEVIRVLDH